MTELTDIDALIADLRNEKWEAEALARRVHTRLYKRAADALESTLAELRQERERADEAWRIGAAQHGYDPTDDEQAGNFVRLAKRADRAESDLARAREALTRIENATRTDLRSSLRVTAIGIIIDQYKKWDKR